MWSLWLGLSVFFPSQHLIFYKYIFKSPETAFKSYVGKVMVARIPPLHIFFGSSKVSSPVQGAPPKGDCCMLGTHRWQICRCWPFFDLSAASPAIILNPCLGLEKVYGYTSTICSIETYRLEGCNLRLAAIYGQFRIREAVQRESPYSYGGM